MLNHHDSTIASDPFASDFRYHSLNISARHAGHPGSQTCFSLLTISLIAPDVARDADLTDSLLIITGASVGSG